MRSQNGVDNNRPGRRQVLDIRHITTAQLAQLGVSRIAYIKPVTVAARTSLPSMPPTGRPMAVAPNRELAWGAILEHEMVPALVN